MNIFYEVIHERDYSGQHALPCRIKRKILEDSVKMLYNNVDKLYLIDLVRHIDDWHVSAIINNHNEALKRK
jgi:Ni,Fe-hydrogenase III component G